MRSATHKRYPFEGEMLTATEITARCSAWSKKYVTEAVRKGATTIAEISAQWEAGMARKRAHCAKPPTPQARILACLQYSPNGHALPSPRFRMLDR